MRSILVGAHRGAMCHAPENTLAAFEKAIAFGTHRIECDVRRSRDGHVVLMHDATVDRTTDGGGRVADLTLAELTRLKVGGTEPIPTLPEALALVRGRCKLLVEIRQARRPARPLWPARHAHLRGDLGALPPHGGSGRGRGRLRPPRLDCAPGGGVRRPPVS